MEGMPKEIKAVIQRNIPDALIKNRDGGRGITLSYVSGATVTDILNEAFDYMWDWVIETQWVQESVDKFNPKYDKEPQPQNPVAHVRGRLIVHFQDGDGNWRHIAKSGYGSKSVIGGQNEQQDIFKAADTDALKKAASRLGIGLELYRDEDEQLHFEERNYVDPWDDEAREKYAEELQFIRDLQEANELSYEDLGDYVNDFDEKLTSIGDITPDNIEEFVEFLKSLVEEEEEGVEA